MTIHHINVITDEAPDPDNPCCIGSAMGGNCTCWTAIYDVLAMPITEGPNPIRDSKCISCAYRPGSPEWNEFDGPPDYSRFQRFYCHQGMPAIIGKYHPDGTVREAEAGDYDPTIVADRSFMADGRPALLCAGWARRNRLVTR